jgi:hypothetical protein
MGQYVIKQSETKPRTRQQPYGMFTKKGEILVENIVNAAMSMMEEMGASNDEAYQFAKRKLETLSAADGFGEATDTAVLDEVFLTINSFAEVQK